MKGCWSSPLNQNTQYIDKVRRNRNYDHLLLCLSADTTISTRQQFRFQYRHQPPLFGAVCRSSCLLKNSWHKLLRFIVDVLIFELLELISRLLLLLLTKKVDYLFVGNKSRCVFKGKFCRDRPMGYLLHFVALALVGVVELSRCVLFLYKTYSVTNPFEKKEDCVKVT